MSLCTTSLHLRFSGLAGIQKDGDVGWPGHLVDDAKSEPNYTFTDIHSLLREQMQAVNDCFMSQAPSSLGFEQEEDNLRHYAGVLQGIWASRPPKALPVLTLRISQLG